MKRLLLIVTLVILSPLVHAQLSFVRSLGGVEEYALPNGLQVLLVRDDTRPVATVNVTYRVGSRHESPGQTGSAHLLEHMLFKPVGEVQDPKRQMQQLSIRWNGTTSTDRTNYFGSFSTQDESLASQRWSLIIQWLSGMMTQARFTANDLKSEMTVVRNEWERSDSDGSRVLGDRMRELAYAQHGYRHPVLGSRQDIERITVDQLYAFYRTHYRPDNATLIVAGRFNADDIKTRIAQAFGPIAKPDTPLPAMLVAQPAQQQSHEVLLQRPDGLGLVAVLYHTPAGGTREGVATRLLSWVLGQDDGPLSLDLVRNGQAATSWAITRTSREPGFLMAGAGLNTLPTDATPAQVEAAAREVAQRMTRLLENPTLLDADIERARTSELRQWRNLRRESEAFASVLSEMVAMGDWRLVVGIPHALSQISAQEVRDLARAYLVPSNRTIGILLPGPAYQLTVASSSPANTATPAAPGSSAPAAALAPAPRVPGASDFVPFVDRAMALANTTPTGTRTDSTASSRHELFDLTADKLKTHTQRSHLLMHSGASPQATPAEGLQIAVIPRVARDDRVVGTLRLRWGSEASLRGSAVLASFIGPMLDEGIAAQPDLGIEARSGKQVRERLQELDARISFGYSAGYLSASLDFPADKTRETLELMHQMLRSPAWPSTAFESQRRQQLLNLQATRTNPGAVAANTMARAVSPPERFGEGDIRTPRSFDETEAQVRSVRLDQLAQHWQRFAGASTGELVLVGPVTLEEVRAPLQRWWGDAPNAWVTREPHSVEVVPFASFANTANRTMRVDGKSNAVYEGRIGLAMNREDADFPALFIGVQLLSRQALWQRVREREGLSYSVGAGLNTPYAPPQNGQAWRDAFISIGASFAPQNKERLLTSIRETLQQVRDNGFTDAEITAERQGVINSLTDPSTPAAAANQIAERIRFDRPLDYSEQFAARYRAVTPAMVNAALRKYLDLGALREVLAGSFE